MAKTSRKVLTLSEQLRSTQRAKEILQAKEYILLNKALSSKNTGELLTAHSILAEMQKKDESTEHKAFFIDPNNWNNAQGYKEKPYAVNYDALRKISYIVPVIRAVINTRINQVCSFCVPQADKYSTGFVIRKKRKWFSSEKPKKASRQEEQKIHLITEAVLNCGVQDSFSTDDFDTFTRKVLNDSLSFDQLCFENRFDENNGSYFDSTAVDGATIRYAHAKEQDNLFDNALSERMNHAINGYTPTTCQIYQNVVQNVFYPWEMCMGIRNPTSSIYANGYGISELEMLINTITSLLWADEYNRKFFSQGSAPKGILNIKAESANTGVVNQFKQQWQQTMAGVGNSHKTPVLTGDVQWIDLQKTNREMEFSSWTEFLIKIACAVFSIDPSEVNFPLSGGAKQQSMFEGDPASRTQHSKDKGLTPLLKFYERRLNRFMVGAMDPEYELAFTGIDTSDPDKDLDRDIKQMSNLRTIDEVRVANGDEPLGEEAGGNIIANSVWMQWYMNKQMMQMQQQAMDEEGTQEGQETFKGLQDDIAQQQELEGVAVDDEVENPFASAFTNYWQKL